MLKTNSKKSAGERTGGAVFLILLAVIMNRWGRSWQSMCRGIIWGRTCIGWRWRKRKLARGAGAISSRGWRVLIRKCFRPPLYPILVTEVGLQRTYAAIKMAWTTFGVWVPPPNRPPTQQLSSSPTINTSQPSSSPSTTRFPSIHFSSQTRTKNTYTITPHPTRTSNLSQQSKINSTT